ncbi:MAG TPA: hypothetical protein VGF14_05620, partial [Alphaproteobacteria bacterium]
QYMNSQKAIKMHWLLLQGLADPQKMPADADLLPLIGWTLQKVKHYSGISGQYPAFEKDRIALTRDEMDSFLFNNYMTYLEINKKKLPAENKKQIAENPGWLSKTVMVAEKFATTDEEKTRLHDFIIGNPGLWNGYMSPRKKTVEDMHIMRDFMHGALMTSPLKKNDIRVYYHTGTKLFMAENKDDLLLMSFEPGKDGLNKAFEYSTFGNKVMDVKEEILNPAPYATILDKEFYNYSLGQVQNFRAKKENNIQVL